MTRRSLSVARLRSIFKLVSMLLLPTIITGGCGPGENVAVAPAHAITVTIVSPLTSGEQAFNPGTGVPLSATISDPIPAHNGSWTATWTFSVRPADGGEVRTFGQPVEVVESNGIWTTNFTLKDIENGSYSAFLEVRDSANGLGTAEVGFVVENAAPLVSCTQTEPPTDDAGILRVDPKQTTTIYCSASDPDGPSEAIALRLEDNLEAPYYFVTPTLPGEWTITAEFTTPGDHYLYVIAQDVSDGIGRSSQIPVKVWNCNPIDGPDPDTLSGCAGDCDDGADVTKDQDGDGFAGCDTVDADCDDLRDDVYPRAFEICNGLDDNCDGVLLDTEEDLDGDGFTGCTFDCDDEDPFTYQGAPELCDGKDNNCDTSIPTAERDGDGDDYIACSSCPEGVLCDDCNDGDAAISPGLPERCGNGKDDNCSGEIDEIYDGDRDGVTTCEDCNDANPLVYPGAPEGPDPDQDGIAECDGLDNDCDQQIDDNTSCVDDDLDGYSELDGDCDDYNYFTFPGALERPDLQDNNCDGQIEGPLTLGTAHVRLSGEQNGVAIGTSLSGANRPTFNADVNGDGYPDLLIGAEAYDAVYPGGLRGAAFVLFGRPTTEWTALEDQTLVSQSILLYEEEGNARAGHSVAMGGDLDNDGLGDIVVGAPYHSVSGGTSIGKAYVVFGKRDGWGKTTLTSASYSVVEGIPGLPTSRNIFVGWSVTGGDINGDGISDLVVNAPWDDGQTSTGWIMIAPGQSRDQWPINILPYHLCRIYGYPDMVLGRSAAIAGFTNGDGVEDLVVGALHDPEDFPGSAVSLLGDAGYQAGYYLNMEQLKAKEYYGTQADGYVADSVSGRVDVDNDGYEDFLVGRKSSLNTESLAYLVFGGETLEPSATLESVSGLVFTSGSDDLDACPCTVQGIGDMNGDGLDDFAVGVAGNDANGANAGKIYIFHGRLSRTDWGTTDDQSTQRQVSLDDADMVLLGETAGDQAGLALAAGDLNKDGWQDLVISAPTWDGGGTDRGRVYAVFGHPAGRNPIPAD